jgi:hypothetical protein
MEDQARGKDLLDEPDGEDTSHEQVRSLPLFLPHSLGVFYAWRTKINPVKKLLSTATRKPK